MPIDGTDRHPYCIQCLGPDHAADAIYAPECPICMDWSREYKLRRLAVAALGPTATHQSTSSRQGTGAPRCYEAAERGSHRPRSRERTPALARSTATKIAGARASSSQAEARGPAPSLASASFSRPYDDMSTAVRPSSELNASAAGDDASSSVSKPEPVAAIFRRAVERCGLRFAEESDNNNNKKGRRSSSLRPEPPRYYARGCGRGQCK